MHLKDLVLARVSAGEDFLASHPGPFLIEEGSLAEDGHELDLLEVRRAFELSAERRLLLGRAREADLRITTKGLSSRHAELIPPAGEETRWSLLDLGSTNGTRMNGVALEAEPCPLELGCVLTLGNTVRLTLFSAEQVVGLLDRMAKRIAPQESPADANLTLRLDPVKARQALRPRPSAPAADPFPADAELLLCCDPYEVLPLLADAAPIVIGRAADLVDLALPNAAVSRKHAAVERRTEGVFVRDLESSNGTFLDEEPLGAEPTPWLPGSILHVARFQLSIELLESRPEQTLNLPPEEARRTVGDLARLPLRDLLLRLEGAHASGVLDLGELGRVYLHAGRPQHAEVADRTGAEAILHLLELRAPEVEFQPGDVYLEPEACTLDQSFSDLVWGDLL